MKPLLMLMALVAIVLISGCTSQSDKDRLLGYLPADDELAGLNYTLFDSNTTYFEGNGTVIGIARKTIAVTESRAQGILMHLALHNSEDDAKIALQKDYDFMAFKVANPVMQGNFSMIATQEFGPAFADDVYYQSVSIKRENVTILANNFDMIFRKGRITGRVSIVREYPTAEEAANIGEIIAEKIG